MFGVEEFEVGGCAIIADQFHFFAEAFGAIENVAFVEVIEDSFKFFGTELGFIMFFELVFEVGSQIFGVADGDGFVAKSR